MVLRRVKRGRTLTNGDCLYSSIYGAAKEQNILEIFKDNDIPVNTQVSFIKKIREIVSDNSDESLSGFYDELVHKHNTNANSFSAILNSDESIDDFQKTLIYKYVIDNSEINKAHFIRDYKVQIKKKGTYSTEIEFNIIKDILSRLEITLVSKSDELEVKELDYHPNTIYIENQGGNHYVYFSFLPEKAQTRKKKPVNKSAKSALKTASKKVNNKNSSA